MQKIIPHLWFDKEAKEAALFYTKAFPHSEITYTNTLHGTPSGDSDIVSFTIAGYSFMAISAGPYFKINPSISFMVNFDPSRDADAEANLNELWKTLSDGGTVRMPLNEYPFSKRYGWIEDRFGVSWQLMLTNPKGEERPLIIPSLMFTQGVYGKAEEATNFYLSVFKDSKRGTLARYPGGTESSEGGAVMFTDIELLGQWFAAMDGAGKHDFAFNEAVSLLVSCETQEDIDYYWEKLSAHPEAEQCGWLKDKYGVSWQISSMRMNDMMKGGTKEQVQRVTDAFLKMKKLDIETLEKAYRGE